MISRAVTALRHTVCSRRPAGEIRTPSTTWPRRSRAGRQGGHKDGQHYLDRVLHDAGVRQPEVFGTWLSVDAVPSASSAALLQDRAAGRELVPRWSSGAGRPVQG
jgi:hypothetical protein